ncbi:facilitated trehalose transporter Tret1-like [Sitophilus oryzae]|uniref:Facilitated trehalose transporter Tret1-like n=1 Tax=Sitophilus oryzae TaxID=7048 RepID=A0A6J2YA59_SITOR|nr:facilitated trehalose transporter Tret1-like [Sitophilus oryzae]XP_030760099.1 facilitated trehalose transporter Tret1-like [Sitophilus oryzae]XP_030760108.1 facilitated trehalose transporter Tret1-like [Sitophilus oryzae]XP_030760116.1 facilitated trehalose transporter Tret1-like [Sitophilus oryzae]
MINIITRFSKWFGSKAVKEEKKDGEPFFMYLSVVLAYLTAFSSGLSVSWTSPVIPKFKTEENPFNHTVSTAQIAMLASFLPLGAITGPILAGYMADRFGRKITMMCLAVPSICGFCILAFAKVIEVWYFARFLLGIGVGCYFAICPMYVAEISQNHNRAKFGCLFGVFITLGLFYPFSIGPHLIIPFYAMSCNVPLILFLIFFGIFMPETPIFLLAKGRTQEAEAALVKLRKKKAVEVQDEINEIMVAVEKDGQNGGGFKEFLRSQPAKRATIICIGLVLLQELSGIHPMMAYLKPIFQASGTTISPDLSTVIFGLSQISSNFITALVVEKIGRRILYMVSAVGCGIACALLGTYFFLQTKEVSLDSVFWLPLTCMVAYMIFFSMGLGPLAWSIVGEIFPSNVKGIGSGLTVCVSFTASFLVLFMFPIVTEAASMAAPFWMYTVVTVLGLIFVYYMVPETRGMTLAEIQDKLKSYAKKDKKKETVNDMANNLENVTHF